MDLILIPVVHHILLFSHLILLNNISQFVFFHLNNFQAKFYTCLLCHKIPVFSIKFCGLQYQVLLTNLKIFQYCKFIVFYCCFDFVSEIYNCKCGCRPFVSEDILIIIEDILLLNVFHYSFIHQLF